MAKTLRYLSLGALALLFTVRALSQISISGLPCAIAGTSNGYLYTLSGELDSTDNITWRVTGGVVSRTGTPALSGALGELGTEVRITWTAGATAGKVEILSRKLGTAELNVRILGITNAIRLSSTIISIGGSVNINGNGVSGSGCAPMYDYWWESAPAAEGPFTPLTNAIGQNVTISTVRQKAYYRRVLSVNGDIIYSNVVLIDPQ